MVNSLQEAQVRAHFRRWVPKKPFATDNLRDGIWQQPKHLALGSRYIQPNGQMIWCLIFDCDHDGTYWAAEDGLLAPPNLVVLNPYNGRGHITYFLKHAVASTDAARIAPLNYLARVQRGMCRRLDADPNYVGLITKNPLHPSWRAFVLSDHHYLLGELDECLHDKNCVPPPVYKASGYGRNCAVFDELRHMAYRSVIEFKRNAAPKAQFKAWACHQADAINAQFDSPMRYSETRAIARSVSKWVWSRFNEATFRQIQARRGHRGNEKRWSGHIALKYQKPWEEMGISRATYYRRKKQSGS